MDGASLRRARHQDVTGPSPMAVTVAALPAPKGPRMIEFRLLGPLHLTDAQGREVQSLLTRPRRLALLAYLAAATPGRLHRRDSLLPLFWPELDQEHARAALRQALHVVRDALGDRKSTRLNSSHSQISYAVFCLKKKKNKTKICR